jgi:hypothetical protein
MATVTKFARGTYSKGVCDVCSVSYPLHELRTTTIRGRATHIKACPECWDKEHPQNFLPEALHIDGQALRDPRPENFWPSRVLPHWYPVDSVVMQTYIGDVEVITS